MTAANSPNLNTALGEALDLARRDGEGGFAFILLTDDNAYVATRNRVAADLSDYPIVATVTNWTPQGEKLP